LAGIHINPQFLRRLWLAGAQYQRPDEDRSSRQDRN
jgi:hypothetical protein